MDGRLPKLRKNAEANACCLSKYSFLFISSTLMRGYRRQLEEGDLFEPLPEHTSETATQRMTEAWEMEKQQAAKANRKPSLVKVVRRLYAKRFILLGILIFMENVFHLLQPIALGLLIRYFRYDSPLSKRDAYLAAAGVGVTSLMISIFHHPYFYSLLKLGMELKTACCGMVMEKGVRLSCGALHRTTVGHMINLLSNDVARFEGTFIFLHYFWIAPLLIVVYIYMLWMEIGFSSLAGFLALLLLVPIQGYFSRRMGKCREEIAVRTDKRVNATSEILNGIRVIKMYAWEDAFANLVGDLRRNELRKVRENSAWQSFVLGTYWASAKLVILFAIICYLLTGHQLSAERVFVATALYNSLLLPVALFLPFAFQSIFETRVSLSRVQAFLELEEYEQNDFFTADKTVVNGGASDETPVEKVPLIRVRQNNGMSNTSSSESTPLIEMINYSAAWDVEGSAIDAGAEVIRNITLSVDKGQLVVVAGPVGSGKSSLLLSILRETQRTWGILRTNGRIAYASQEAWIFPGSVRDNILFGRPYIKTLYDRALEICALKQDLSQLPYGDKSSVGDRGQSLSGGQKARISLARTIYMDADIYLLDDPLSAVDTAVGRFLFNRCIKQYLKSKAVILVTHQVQHLQCADLVVLMRAGEIVASGSLKDLKQTAIYSEILQETEKSYSLQRTESEGGASVRWIKFSVSEDSDDILFKTGKFYRLPTSFYVTKEGSEAQKIVTQESSINDLTRSRLSLSSPAKSVGSSSHSPKTEVEDVLYVGDEDRAEGAVPWRIYFLYVKAMAHPCFPAFLMISFAAAVQAFTNFIDWWLNKWTNAAEMATKQYDREKELHWNHVEYVDHFHFGPFTVSETLTSYRNAFIAMVCILVVVSVARSIWFRLTQVIASRILHDSMFQRVVGTTVSFYDKNPTGRILNRFSKDVGTLDDQLSFAFFDFSMGMLTFFGYICVIVIINPIVLAITAPLIMLFIFLRSFYLSTSRDVKRLEATTRSPLYSHISSVMYGLISVRAFCNQHHVTDTFHKYQNVNTAALYLNLCTARWFGAVIDWVVAVFITAVAFLCIASPATLTGGEVGLMLVYAIQLLGHFSWIMRQSAELQNGMVSVERIIDYSELPLEPVNEGAVAPPPNWPSEGHLQFQNVSMRYEEGALPVLKNIEADIAPKEKIGVVGRTGAGKSSLLRALFRLTESEGNIFIDNINTKTVALKVLRKRISIIPQDPVLFIGTLLKNLDPFSEYSTEKVWRVLEQVELKNAVSELPLALETHMQEGGANFSVGQRQLICLARALLRQSKILVIDEATANVDPLTDSLIQKTIKECFRESTVLTIAHRLHTIMDSDRVMVLENGELIEFDHPYKLLCESESSFAALAAETGEENVRRLKQIAAQASEKRKQRSTKSESEP